MEADRETPPRIAFYSHDSVGLGHVHRNLRLAHALHAMYPRPEMLVITGTIDAALLPRPDGCDVVSLPALSKQSDGTYRARHLSLDLVELLQIRRAIITGALTSFAPHLLIVDRYARGFRGELEPALDALVEDGTTVVLGLRDVLDDRDAVRTEWAMDRSLDALRRWYAEVWAYSDATLLDPLAPITDRVPVPVRATGYLADASTFERGGSGPRLVPERAPSARRGDAPMVLGLLGGGADGGALATALAQAPLPTGTSCLILCGPQMADRERERVTALASRRDNVTIVRSVPDVRPLVADAAAVVAMAGYNTTCELLASDVPVLVVPRVGPRREQRLRAEAFAARGALDVLPPESATPAALGGWLAKALGAGWGSAPNTARTAIARDGLATMRGHALRLLESRAGATIGGFGAELEVARA